MRVSIPSFLIAASALMAGGVSAGPFPAAATRGYVPTSWSVDGTPHDAPRSIARSLMGLSSEPILDNNDISCSAIGVIAPDLDENLREKLARTSLTDAFDIDVVSGNFSNHSVHYGPATFKLKWEPVEDVSRCFFSHAYGLFSNMLRQYDSACSGAPTPSVWEQAPRHANGTFPNCGHADFLHADIVDGKAYRDEKAFPGFKSCTASNFRFRKADAKPLIERFCDDFAASASADAVAVAKRQVAEQDYFLQTFHGIGVFEDKRPSHKRAEKAADAAAAGGDATSPLSILATFDRHACNGTETLPRFPDKVQCVGLLEEAVDASGNVATCTRECTLANNGEGDWQLGYCEHYQEPDREMSSGGYVWDHCLRWGVVIDKSEGLLGMVPDA